MTYFEEHHEKRIFEVLYRLQEARFSKNMLNTKKETQTIGRLIFKMKLLACAEMFFSNIL